MTKSSACRAIALSLAAFLSYRLPIVIAADTYQRSWLAYGGFGQRDTASAIAVDSSGNPILIGETGSIYGTPPTELFGGFIVNFDPSGHETRMQRVNAWRPYAGAFDSADNLHLAGIGRRPISDQAYLAKFDQNGNQLWEQFLGSSNSDAAFDVDIDSQGNTYISGTAIGLPGATNSRAVSAFLAKYAPDGTETWFQPLTTLGFYGESLAVSPDQSVFLTGIGYRTSFLAHLDSAGNILWSKSMEFSADAQNGTYAQQITCDSLGNVFVVGQTNQPINSLQYDAFVAKFDSGGQLLWKRVLHISRENAWSDVAVDSLGNVYAAGTVGAFQGTTFDNYDAMWVKYDSEGNLRWFEQFGTPGDDALTGIAVDLFGRVYISGNNFYTKNDYYLADGNAFIARYDQVPEPSTLLLFLIGIFLGKCSFRRRRYSGE
jgi:PEP-CTERM motif/Beta-propeller repeat